ncbi:hypothetical protein JR316_0001774 [Psilocybe cubensis]|uniref:F-box domain-containing protein n=2 Tax=Psilocybe cubensis TaxID=181762 RepID=A0A8H8CPM9_PSICU|nr:hypothetical protein JR316_0001774 [Psilocybe cubensis]KAH9484872.1 hypothetical protein JR316_0001774 [Psilocybe cubensis]
MARTLIRANHRAKQSVKIAIISSLPGATDIILPDPPVPRLLISNQPPTESELALISESIQAAQAEATRLSETLNKTKSDREISRALELVTIYKLEAANQFIRQHQGIISIVRRLPVEILQEVFLWVGTSLFEPNAWSSPRSFVIYNSGPQWNLAQICHSWRTIALNISSLWKLPSITLDNSGTRSKLQLQCIKELLRRSKGQPLHLNITCSYDFEGESHPVLNFLCQYAESWETLCVKLPCKAFAALRSLRGRLPALRRIDLSTSSWSWTWSVVEPNDCFQSAPLLTTVYVESPLRAMFPLPFKQLLHYTEDHGIGLTSPTNWTPPNFDFHALTTLSLTFYSEGYVFPHIALSFLVSLEIRVFYNCPTMRSCFDYLKVPAIQILHITADHDNTMPSLARMLNNSSPCPLKKLTLRHPKRVGPNELSELLLFAPELDTLSVNLPMSSSDILNLAYGYKHQPLVPLLRTCAFHHYKRINEGETTDAAIMDALNRLARSRCEDRYKIESDFSIMSIERLEAFEDFKLSISFEHFEGPMLELHASFNNWSPSTTTSNTLLSLKSELLEVVPRLREGYCSLDHPALARNRKVNDILNSIESMPVGDVRDIVQSAQDPSTLPIRGKNFIQMENFAK